MEQITEDSFYGQDEDNPRQPGFYAVDVVTLADGKSCVPRPWFAVYRDQSRDVGQQRDNDAANLNFSTQMRQQATQNLAPFNNNLSQSLASYRLP